MYRVIVTGSREWTDAAAIEVTLRKRIALHGTDIVVVHGNARGADKIAAAVAKRLGLQVESHSAHWEREGRLAGFIRNEHMLRLGADAVLAFKDSFDRTLSRGGTEHMVRISKAAGIPVALITHQKEAS